jgi:hypothetical protein
MSRFMQPFYKSEDCTHHIKTALMMQIDLQLSKQILRLETNVPPRRQSLVEADSHNAATKI